MIMEVFEMREEMYRLKARLAVSEQQLSDGAKAHSLDEAKAMLLNTMDKRNEAELSRGDLCL